MDGGRHRAKLRELAANAAREPEEWGLSLSYERGHELSGTVSLTVDEDGSFTVAKSQRGSLNPTSAFGRLTPAQRSELAAAIDDSAVLDVLSSHRLLAQDEVPILLKLRAGDLEHSLALWAGDASEHPQFTNFERTVLRIVDQLLAPS